MIFDLLLKNLDGDHKQGFIYTGNVRVKWDILLGTSRKTSDRRKKT